MSKNNVGSLAFFRKTARNFPAQNDTGNFLLYTHRGLDNMTDDINALQAKYIHAEAERLRLKQLNSALRTQIADNKRAFSADLSPVPPDFLPPDEKIPDDIADSAGLWRNFTSTNLGLNKRYRIYTGYLFERMGWSVDYFCGRNLICRKEGRIIVALTESAATIDLDNMYSLLGAAMEYKRDNVSDGVSAMCFTSSALISRVKTLAQKFGIAIREHFYFKNFPCIRCKADLDGKRVYYVPDDEGYLSVRVNLSEGDKYCWSEEDAQYVGFTRAETS